MDAIDFQRAIKAPFNDPEWVKKALLGWLWMLLMVTSPAVYGAMIEYIRGVSEGREDLPDWSDFGNKWVKGFLVSVAGFIYFLPVMILGAFFLIPVFVAIASGSNSFGGLAAGGMCLFWIIAIVYVAAVSVLFYAAIVNYALKGSFGAMFEFSAILGRVRDGSGYFVAWVWALVVGFGASIAMGILQVIPFIGSIASIAVIYLEFMIVAHLFGQWAAKSYGIAQAAAPAGYAPPGYIPPAGAASPPPPPAPPAYTPPAPPAPPAYAPPAPPAAPPSEPAAPPIAPPPAPPAYTPPAPPAPTPEAEPQSAPEPAPWTPPAPPAAPPATDVGEGEGTTPTP